MQDGGAGQQNRGGGAGHGKRQPADFARRPGAGAVGDIVIPVARNCGADARIDVARGKNAGAASEW